MVKYLASQSDSGIIKKKFVSRVSILALTLMIGGCSWVPDWADPTEWFGDDDDSDRPQAIEVAEGDKEFPSLGTVPATLGSTISIADAENVKEGLAADRANAKYTDQSLRADTSTQIAPAPKVVQPAAVLQPAAAAIQLLSPAGQTVPVQMAPITGTTVIGGNGSAVHSIYQQQLAASSATVSTLPANIGFQVQPIHPIRQSAVAISPIVQNTYNQPIVIGSSGQVINSAAASGSTRPMPASFAGQSYASAGGAANAIIKFGPGSHRVGAGDKQKLQQIANTVKSAGGRIMVVGHASSRTRDLSVERHMMVNLRISQKRADSVANALKSMGVPGDRIVAQAISDSQPIYAEAMPRGEAENRRVEIFLVN